MTDAAQKHARDPVGADIDRPSVSRVYNYSLGGKDNYAIDREAWAKITKGAPRLDYVHKLNRAWLAHVVRYLAQHADITQFVDLGAGLPTWVNTHQIAQEWERRDVRVVYVDNDPVCAAHGRAILETCQHSHYLRADCTDPEQLFRSCETHCALDTDRPFAVLATGVLHHLDDAVDPAGLMARYADLLPAGSYIAVTHYLDPGPEAPELHEIARTTEQAFLDALGSGWFRTQEQIHGLFGGLDLIAPGLVDLDDWWPTGPPWQRTPEEQLMVGGLAYKPLPLPSRLVHSE